MTQLAITAIDNKNLFSNYYLDNQIKKNPEWKKEEHKAAFSEIKKLYDMEKDFLPGLNEKQLEQRFFAPIFKILNHTVEVNQGTESQEFPDYAFFSDRSSLDDAHNLENNKQKILSRAIIKDKVPKGEMEWFELQQINKNIDFTKSQIIYPDISDYSNFNLSQEGSLIDMTAFIIPTNDKYLLSLLNSNLLTWLLGLFCARARGDYYRYKTQYVSRLPIRRISFTTPPDRRAALAAEAKALYSEYLGAPGAADLDRINRMDRINESTNPVNPVNPVQTVASFSGAPDSLKILEFIGARLSAAPEESDVVHDLLAYLAERMIEMNKEKNAEIKSFLDFLKGEIGVSIDDLSNKTAIKEYVEHEFQDLIDALTKNKKKLKAGYDPKSPTNYKLLQQWYNDSIGKLKPLMGRIEATDELIDAIYKLYGLTDDEIKIVEGSITGNNIISEDSKLLTKEIKGDEK